MPSSIRSPDRRSFLHGRFWIERTVLSRSLTQPRRPAMRDFGPHAAACRQHLAHEGPEWAHVGVDPACSAMSGAIELDNLVKMPCDTYRMIDFATGFSQEVAVEFGLGSQPFRAPFDVRSRSGCRRREA
jgi:hypothetical protein